MAEKRGRASSEPESQKRLRASSRGFRGNSRRSRHSSCVIIPSDCPVARWIKCLSSVQQRRHAMSYRAAHSEKLRPLVCRASVPPTRSFRCKRRAPGRPSTAAEGSEAKFKLTHYQPEQSVRRPHRHCGNSPVGAAWPPGIIVVPPRLPSATAHARTARPEFTPKIAAEWVAEGDNQDQHQHARGGQHSRHPRQAASTGSGRQGTNRRRPSEPRRRSARTKRCPEWWSAQRAVSLVSRPMTFTRSTA